MTKTPDNPKPIVCVYCGETINPETDVYGHTSDGDQEPGFWHWDCKTHTPPLKDKKRPPQK